MAELIKWKWSWSAGEVGRSAAGGVWAAGYEREVAVIRLWNDGSHLSQQA